MSSIETISSAIEKLLEAAKDVPPEKIAMVGLILLGTASVVKDIATGNTEGAIEKAKTIIDVT